MKRKFYAVAHGRQPGIYTDWESTAAQVERFAGTRHKAFDSREQAQDWLDGFLEGQGLRQRAADNVPQGEQAAADNVPPRVDVTLRMPPVSQRRLWPPQQAVDSADPAPLQPASSAATAAAIARAAASTGAGAGAPAADPANDPLPEVFALAGAGAPAADPANDPSPDVFALSEEQQTFVDLVVSLQRNVLLTGVGGTAPVGGTGESAAQLLV
ncbi:Caulimovirus viroplasmin-domain-containing protein [Pavlovales sp. CCMP2436]|nr:Caulimovirus viroplasmin-domain-containing protein [Pavlovales sp. CCMP2436]